MDLGAGERSQIACFSLMTRMGGFAYEGRLKVRVFLWLGFAMCVCLRKLETGRGLM